MNEDRAQYIDGAKDVRQGEELDVERLRAYLSKVLPDVEGALTVRQFPRGHSNLTYLLDVGGRELVLRRPPFGASVKTAHDMGREYRILSGLAPVYDRAPKPLAYCEDADVLGAPFYVMQRVAGVILRGPRPPKALGLDAHRMRALSVALVDGLATLHAVDVAAAGLSELGRVEGYVERQIRGWTKRYYDAKTDEVPQVERVADWLANNQPAESGGALIHNDYRFDNVVLDPEDVTRIVAVLDWEMATVGDPLMDLGTALGYWIDPDDADEAKMIALGPTLVDGCLSRRGVVEQYERATGRSVGDPLFYYVFGLFKIAVIAQQIYKRFKEGHTKDPRFAMMIAAVQLLGQQASIALDRGLI